MIVDQPFSWGRKVIHVVDRSINTILLTLELLLIAIFFLTLFVRMIWPIGLPDTGFEITLTRSIDAAQR